MTAHYRKPTAGRIRTSELDAAPRPGECSPDEPLFMPEEHAVAVMRNEDNPVSAVVRMLQAMENGEVGTVAEGHWYALANGLEKYQAERADAFKQLQTRLDVSERAFAKFMDDVACAINLCEVPEDQSETPEWVLRELRKFVDEKPGNDYVACRLVFDLLDDISKTHNSDVLQKHKPNKPLSAINLLVDDIAKRKNPSVLRTEVDSLTGKLQEAESRLIVVLDENRQMKNADSETLTQLRKMVRPFLGVPTTDPAFPENPIKEIADVLSKYYHRLKDNEDEKERGIDELRELVQEFGGGLSDRPFDALRDMLETMRKNQKPDNMDANLQTVITANARLNATLQAIEAVINTAKV